ncbi:cytochrome P450 [Mycena pura]|uniref:Cytochrome P450 n=1 Tax=Mycena pura TaxID=153505 RepID=A0AAD6VB85_9AGAR|nr:cytochrome P450 [Mycena pura]
MPIISRVSNRLFIGLKCRDPDYISITTRFTQDVIKDAIWLQITPAILRPIVLRMFGHLEGVTRNAINHVGPMIQYRLDMDDKYGADWPDSERPNDLISWLLDEARGHPKRRTVRNLTLCLLNINFGAIHTTTQGLLHALYNLAANLECLEPLRAEVQSVVASHGWTKEAMGMMVKLDSFMKESSRLKPGAAVNVMRQAVTDFTFSDGTTVPAGTLIGISFAEHQDEANYTNASVFDPFRFSRMREEAGDGTKHQMVTPSSEFLSFGIGRHACPGRFFAVNEQKLIMAHILVTYDVKLRDSNADRTGARAKKFRSPLAAASNTHDKSQNPMKSSYSSLPMSTDLINLVTLACASAAFYVVFYLARTAFKTSHASLNSIPSVGVPRGPFGFYVGAWNVLKNGRAVTEEGYLKYRGKAFKIPLANRWLVILSGRMSIDDIRKAPDGSLSLPEGTNSMLHIEYTLGHDQFHDPYHNGVVRTALTRNIGVRFPDIRDEVVAALKDLIPAKSDGIMDDGACYADPYAYHLQGFQQAVYRTSGRDPDYLNITTKFTQDVMKDAVWLQITPAILRPIVLRIFGHLEGVTRNTIHHVGPMIQYRLGMDDKYGADWPDSDRPNDLISWLLDEARGHPKRRTVRNLTLCLLNLNFGAIHTTTQGLLHALYNLAANLECLEPLRAEVESIVASHGWTKEAMGKMVKLDSFMKESSRLKPGGEVGVTRLALTDFTFSDGTTVPAGTLIGVSLAEHQDEANYTNASAFDPFRFSRMREEAGEGTKHQMVTASPEFLSFGVGRHACPGRFFAVNEQKLIMAHILVTYDVKLRDGLLGKGPMFAGSINPVTLASASAVAFVIFHLARATFKIPHASLDSIPSVGVPWGPFGFYVGAWNVLKNGRAVTEEGFLKYRGKAFKIPLVNRWLVVANGRMLIEDIRNAPDSSLSLLEGTNSLLHIEHTLGHDQFHDAYQIGVIRSALTRNIGVCFPDVRDEVVAAFKDLLPANSDGIMDDGACFAGRDPDYINITTSFTQGVIKDALLSQITPSVLRPLVLRLFGHMRGITRDTIKLLRPMIQYRLDMDDKYGADWPNSDRPNDLISWLLDEARGHPKRRTVRNLTLCLLNVNFGALHTTTQGLVHALYNLAANLEYIEPLRAEVESVVASRGWTKEAMGKMVKLDSFMKESARLKPGSGVTVMRLALTDFTFSDGTTVPAGTLIGIPLLAEHQDEANYTNASTFDPFRFSRMREEAGEGTKHQMVTPNSKYLSFGIGRHACPGRFFAVNEQKLMLAHVLMTYDFKLRDGVRPADEWIALMFSPSTTAELMFRRRS